jgi:hypothetical protein
MSRDSSVGIVTRYGLDGPGIESQWGGGGGETKTRRSVGETFRNRPDRPWGGAYLYSKPAQYRIPLHTLRLLRMGCGKYLNPAGSNIWLQKYIKNFIIYTLHQTNDQSDQICEDDAGRDT